MGRAAVATKESVMAAVRQLTESGESVNVDSVRSITGGGSNERVAALIKECQAELKADEAQLLAINPSLAKLGSQLFERAVLQIVAEVERDAKQRVKLIEVKAANDVDEARQQEKVALGAADRAERERDELREECEHLRQSAAIADGKLAQLAAQLTDERQRAAAQLVEERERAATAIDRAEAARAVAQTELAEARQQEKVALGLADRAERERDELREECEHLRQSAATADGKLAQLTAQIADERQRAAAQLTEERDRAAAAIERAEAAKVKAQSEAAEARGEITALRTQLRELQNELAAVRAQAKKGGGK